ncbi:MAG: phosphonatase-like hydrolase [Flavobacteriaceae bacterium]|nr:phosphonatase-like hydrolase [Flavobacteriaceae bacterium]
MQHIKLVVLDMAGTTIDEQNVVYKTLHKAINAHGVVVDLETVLKHGAGKEKHQAIKDILHFLGNSSLSSQAIFADFKTMLDAAYDNLEVCPITGVEATIKALRERHITVVLNTGYNSKVANGLLQKMAWEEGIHYDALITADDVTNGRPAPDMIHLAMDKFEITDANMVLKAGDSAIDIEEGKNANCGITVGVLSGAQTKSQLETAQPDYIMQNVAGLLEL